MVLIERDPELTFLVMGVAIPRLVDIEVCDAHCNSAFKLFLSG